MTKKKTIESYDDIIRLLGLALERKGLRIRQPTPAKAMSYRHRIYRGRLCYFETTNDAKFNGLYVRLVYPDGTIQGAGKILRPGEPIYIELRRHADRALPELESLDGGDLSITSLPATPAVEVDPEFADALAMAKNNLNLLEE